MRIYAQPDDLSNDGWLDSITQDSWQDGIPKKATAYLRDASQLVEKYTAFHWYDTDEQGYPTQPHVKDAFKNAVCKQVTVWVNAGLDPTKGEGGQTPQISNQSVPGGSVTYTGTKTVKELGESLTTLDPSVALILDNAHIGSRRLR